jgi:protein required for attachment to host cells
LQCKFGDQESIMASHWIVVADAATARILEGDDLLDELRQIERLHHPQARQKAAQIVSDDRGRSRTFQGEHTALDRRTDPHRAELQAFAHEIGARLLAAYNQHAFERVIVVAPPQFLGALRGELDGFLGDALVATINKDFTQVPLHELSERIRAELPPTVGLP